MIRDRSSHIGSFDVEHMHLTGIVDEIRLCFDLTRHRINREFRMAICRRFQTSTTPNTRIPR